MYLSGMRSMAGQNVPAVTPCQQPQIKLGPRSRPAGSNFVQFYPTGTVRGSWPGTRGQTGLFAKKRKWCIWSSRSTHKARIVHRHGSWSPEANQLAAACYNPAVTVNSPRRLGGIHHQKVKRAFNSVQQTCGQRERMRNELELFWDTGHMPQTI